MTLLSHTRPMLYIFGGLPGSGKSTLAKHLARELAVAYIRVDSIEEAIEEEQPLIGPEGYKAAYRLAEDNLLNGLSVVADTVNPLELTRSAWREVAKRTNASAIEIEIVCTCALEHQKRIELRGVELTGRRTLQWEDVTSRHYERWSPDFVLDTANESPEQSQARLILALVGRANMSEQIFSDLDQFLRLVTEAPEPTLRGLKLYLDQIVLQAEKLSVETTALEPNIPHVTETTIDRESISLRFPTLGFYNCASPITADIGSADITVGDAIDDLLDIANELLQVQAARAQHRETQALALLRWSYSNHWGLHARSLQLFLFALGREEGKELIESL